MTTRNVPRLISLFKSAAEIGRIAGVHRTAVGRWIEFDWKISPDIQAKLLTEAKLRGMDLGEVAHCLGVERCRCCGEPVDLTVSQILENWSAPERPKIRYRKPKTEKVA